MKNNKDFDFIKSKFEEENITAPITLSENAVMTKLEKTEPKKIRLYQSKVFKGIMSAVACVAVVFTVFAVTKPYIFNDDMTTIDVEPPQSQVMNTFTNFEELKSSVNEIMFSPYYDTGGKGGGPTVNDILNYAEEGGAAYDESYAETYKQVDAVDEADIIKNDGKHIYYVNCGDSIVKIFTKDNDDMVLTSTIDDFALGDYDGSYEVKESESVVDLYIYDNYLVVNTIKWECIDEKDDYATVSYIYDVSDAANPKLLNSFEQSGTYVSSRMIGSQLYMVSNDLLVPYACKTDSDYLPYVCNGIDGKTEYLPLEDICYAEKLSNSSYLVVSTINIETGQKTADTKALFGAGSEIYCSENNMYVAIDELQWKTLEDGNEFADSELQLVKIKLSESDIKFVAECKIPGRTVNQFSMDEKDGKLRVATTSYNKDGKEINNLFVFDENLKKIGELTGFAEDESIRAVRFIGDTAYVITYKDIDPLFVIDVSDPANPQMKGEVEITGFSSLLVPVDNNTLLGIGYSTENENGMESTDGLKLALFDVSNPEKPQVLDSYVMKNAYSEAQYNHHAITVNYAEGYFAIPCDWSDNEYSDSETGAIIITAKNGKIEITNRFSIDTNTTANRCTYIDDTFYIFDYLGDVFSFNLSE